MATTTAATPNPDKAVPQAPQLKSFQAGRDDGAHAAARTLNLRHPILLLTNPTLDLLRVL